jgi:hypothetical protein
MYKKLLLGALICLCIPLLIWLLHNFLTNGYGEKFANRKNYEESVYYEIVAQFSINVSIVRELSYVFYFAGNLALVEVFGISKFVQAVQFILFSIIGIFTPVILSLDSDMRVHFCITYAGVLICVGLATIYKNRQRFRL